MGNGSILISLSIALLVGLLLTRVAKLVKLPAVTAYLIAGVLIGPYLPIYGFGLATLTCIYYVLKDSSLNPIIIILLINKFYFFLF